MQTNSSDKCYVYFDKYNMPQVTEVTATEVTSNSITVSVTASGGDGDIVSYHYSRDNGTSYVTSENNTYTFTGLTAETPYKISVCAIDSNGRKASVYNVDITTKEVTYTLVTSESLSNAPDNGCEIYLNDEKINIGDVITYKVGDVLRYEQIWAFSGGNGLRIYDANGSIIKEIIGEYYSPSTVEEYILTGLEAKIIAYASGRPEIGL